MKRLISHINFAMFFIAYNFFCFIFSRESVQDKVVEYLSEDILSAIKYSVKELGMLELEIEIMKELLFITFTENFYYLEKDKNEIKKKVYKNINHKIKWIVSNKGM